MKFFHAVFCLIVMLGLSTAVTGKLCRITCGQRSSPTPCDPQKMEQLGLKCPSPDAQFHACMKRCAEQTREEQELENQLKNERFRQHQLRKERLRERSQKH